MPPRVTYWTGVWDPAQEAISKEVQQLRAAGGRLQPVVSFSRSQRAALFAADRVVRLGPRYWPLLRVLAPAIERCGEVTHVFGGLGSWHLLRVVGRRPVVLTAVIAGGREHPGRWSHISRVAAESEALVAELLQAGVPRDRIELIYPGVDLFVYRPAPQPVGHRPFRLLFASSPKDPAELDRRGIPLLVETARQCPDIEVTLLWRAWGDQSAARVALDRLRPPANVRIARLDGRDMAAVYQDADAIACLYEMGFGKSCPNSVIEALACGLPALLSEGCGIAPLVAAHGAGIAVRRTVPEVVQALRALRLSAAASARAARALAERHFDERTFLSAYARLYAEIAVTAAETGSAAAPSRSRSRSASAPLTPQIPPNRRHPAR